jgi:hypothetical protein
MGNNDKEKKVLFSITSKFISAPHFPKISCMSELSRDIIGELRYYS